jgi:hypothetical protein
VTSKVDYGHGGDTAGWTRACS